VRILLLEDDKNAGAALSELLELDGHEVCLAATLAAARDYIADHTFDVALLDIQLPDGDGKSLVSLLKQRQTRVYLATGSTKLTLNSPVLTFEDPEELARSCGADGALSKPIDYQHLINLLA
jgi:DNA-binding response OmpR family regulator